MKSILLCLKDGKPDEISDLLDFGLKSVCRWLNHYGREEVDAYQKEIEPWFLPPHSPQFNPVESLWEYTRRQETYNNFFPTIDALIGSIETVFRSVQHRPYLVQNYLVPYH